VKARPSGPPELIGGRAILRAHLGKLGVIGVGRLRVHLQATLDLAEAAKAHELLESGGVTGMIALTV
jgi:hypothetical protein